MNKSATDHARCSFLDSERFGTVRGSFAVWAAVARSHLFSNGFPQVATLQMQLRSGEARIRGLERHVGELMRRVSR